MAIGAAVDIREAYYVKSISSLFVAELETSKPINVDKADEEPIWSWFSAKLESRQSRCFAPIASPDLCSAEPRESAFTGDRARH